jgi:hypothetical protein
MNEWMNESLDLSLSTCGCLEWRISGWSHAYPCFVVGISSSTLSRAASRRCWQLGPRTGPDFPRTGVINKKNIFFSFWRTYSERN